MHPFVFLAVCLAGLGVSSYGVQLTPLEPQPKQFAQFALVIVFLAVVARHFGVM